MENEIVELKTEIDSLKGGKDMLLLTFVRVFSSMYKYQFLFSNYRYFADSVAVLQSRPTATGGPKAKAIGRARGQMVTNNELIIYNFEFFKGQKPIKKLSILN
jgi:hypothetical protein